MSGIIGVIIGAAIAVICMKIERFFDLLEAKSDEKTISF